MHLTILLAIFGIVFAHPAISAPLTGREAFDEGSLARWMLLSDADKDATIQTLMAAGGNEVPVNNTQNIKACAQDKASSSEFTGYDFATAYTACLFKLGLN
jgi:hypothetical protein